MESQPGEGRKKKRTRKPNGDSSIYYGKDGRWHGRVTVGVKDDGRPDRRHASRKTRTEIVKEVRRLERMRDQGDVRSPGRPWKVKTWLVHWVENIAPLTVGENTIEGYRVAVNVHLAPGVGEHRIDRLQPEHLERLYRRMQQRGSKPATAHQAHRTIRAALNEAVRRGHLTRNPATLAKAPRLTDDDEIEPYSVAEVRRILQQAARLPRNGVRWAVALALGLRQSEALGLKWADIDLANATLRVRRARLRPRYRHGCGNFPCGRKAGHCPKRQNARHATSGTKSRSGRRVVGLPPQLVALLVEHRERQHEEQARAGALWCDEGWVFTDPRGRALNPNTDYRAWKRLLKSAGVRDGRLHDARHTAATVLLLGVPERTAMGIMGWSSTSMAARYQHIVAPIRTDIANRVNDLLWSPSAQAIEAAHTLDDDGD